MSSATGGIGHVSTAPSHPSASLGTKLWGSERTLARAAESIRETFDVDTVMKAHAFTYRNKVQESGNQVLKPGVTNGYRMEQERDTSGGTDSLLVANNDILDLWKTGYGDERRHIVRSYEASGTDRAQERNRTMVTRMPTEDLDVMA